MQIAASEYKQRRQKIFDKMADNSVAFLLSAPHYERNFDCDMIYRQSSDFYYATGFPEPDSIAVFVKQAGENTYILFNKKRDPAQEIWTGHIIGQARACSEYGADASFEIEEFESELINLLDEKETLYFEFGCHPDFEQVLMASVHELQTKVRYGVDSPKDMQNIHKILHALRLIKSPTEIALMANVGDISAKAHLRCMQATKPGMHEYQIEAEFIHETLSAGCKLQAYPGIFAGGDNACILHYTSNMAQLNDGDLLLIDAGAEMDCYASDITRTFPVNGKFTGEQRALYELVLASQLNAISMVKPGATRETIEAATDKILAQGLLDLGIIKGSLDGILEQRHHKQFYMHRIGHWLGMDVHDRGDYVVKGNSRVYEPGIALTIEPGLYIPPNTKGVDEKWLGLGIRIEDDVIVTDNEPRVLTSAAPKTIDEIEAVMKAV